MAGIVETIKLAGILILAIPAALAGVEFLFVRGEPLIGAGLIAVAIALVALRRYLALPTGLSGVLASRAEEAITPDDEAE
ncbi:DUF7533 family protein [Halovivax gelatinilyticus]|uniref:DUF7533 family protein n=1 Tax=Halovivax gelatinilyticus TaxID=2961597 RepID=UPI0020CA772C|nr:hypothetical protein [Halovivax gelatinilyticus]